MPHTSPALWELFSGSLGWRAVEVLCCVCWWIQPGSSSIKPCASQRQYRPSQAFSDASLYCVLGVWSKGTQSGLRKSVLQDRTLFFRGFDKVLYYNMESINPKRNFILQTGRVRVILLHARGCTVLYQLVQHQNCGFNLQPCWGRQLHQAISCNSAILTVVVTCSSVSKYFIKQWRLLW